MAALPMDAAYICIYHRDIHCNAVPGVAREKPLRIDQRYFLAASIFLAGAACAQEILYQPDPDSPIGVRNPDAPEGTAQYAFLIGDWDVDVTLSREGQEPLQFRAKWHNHWIADGYAVMQEWRGPYATGIEIRTYDAAEDTWQGRNIYFPSPATWYDNAARMIGAEMVVTTRRVDAAGATSITREIYFERQKSSFRIRTEVSTDGGVSWAAGRYSAICQRADRAR
jgi:hypothetical protein